MNILAVVKAIDEPATRVVTFAEDLQDGESLDGVVVSHVMPVTSVPLDVLLEPIAGQPNQRTIKIDGGQSGITYGVRLRIRLSSGRTTTASVGVQVQDSPFSQLRTRSPRSFKPLLEAIEAGEVGVGKGIFTLEPDVDYRSASIYWELIDQEGTVYSAGNAFDYQVVRTSTVSRLEGMALVNVPSDVPASLIGQTFQVRWQLHGVGPVPIYAFENVKIVTNVSVPVGVQPIVELENHPIELALVLEHPYEHVEVEVFDGNYSVMPSTPAKLRDRAEGGYYYSVQLTPRRGQLPAQLEPYTAIWRYRNLAASGTGTSTLGGSHAPMGVNVEQGSLHIVNPSLLQAINTVQQTLQKARSSLLRFPDVLFEPPTVLNWLQRGRDFFNGVGERLTSFTMTNAQGALREFWLQYSEVAACRAHYLAEGEKAFDFSGDAIQLSRDVTQYYQTYADNLQGILDAQVPKFKVQLLRAGLSGGPGDMTDNPGSAAGRNGSGAVVAISRSPITHRAAFRNYPGGYKNARMLRRYS